MINKKTKGFNISNSIYIVFCIYIVTMLLSETSISILDEIFENIIRIIRYVCYFFFIAKAFWNWKNGKNKITLTMFLIGILFLIIYYFSGKKNLLIMFIALISLKNTDKNKIIKAALITYIITYSLVIFVSIIGLIPDWTYT